MKFFGVLRPSTRASLRVIRGRLLDRQNCTWQKIFLERLEYSVSAIAPVLPLAFHYAAIISTFDDMGWAPFNLRKILLRAQDVSEAVILACERAWIKLLLNCRSVFFWHNCLMFIPSCCRNKCLITDAEFSDAGAPAFDEKGRVCFRTYEQQKEADRKHDSQCLNRLRAVTLTHGAFEDFNKKLQEKKLRKQPKRVSIRQESKQDREKKAALLKQMQEKHKPTKALMNDVVRLGRKAQKEKETEKETKKESKPNKGESKQKLVPKSRTSAPKIQPEKRETERSVQSETQKKRKRKREEGDTEYEDD
jgi:hypothetical protein